MFAYPFVLFIYLLNFCELSLPLKCFHLSTFLLDCCFIWSLCSVHFLVSLSRALLLFLRLKVVLHRKVSSFCTIIMDHYVALYLVHWLGQPIPPYFVVSPWFPWHYFFQG
ncbi:hypothetical protein V8G54_005046 [Vigna mungo]|uniref:Uncharacterized protein n=1 Tax=Vigna mungo TaxID=3915 RepID=A0AAQ3PF42_VIGMU